MAMEAVAELIDVRKYYQMGTQTVRALNGVSLSFQQGDYYAIMGPSGSGKSTLLNLLGCLDRPSGGRYLLGGIDVATLSDNALSDTRSRRLGFVFQSFNLIAQLTVIENIELPLVYQGGSTSQARHRAYELAAMVGLETRTDHRPAQLSGGQQQRVAIARAMINDPLVILADEPTGNLDSATQGEIMDLLDSLNQAGTTIILVTHEDDIAHRARHVLNLADGRIVNIETAAERRRRFGLEVEA
ncbi:MAG: putative ABC transporter ATP-binding protein YknY [Phycisphaerae bacterium]|nr:putative ABC transporter ATP-binding protein YknY [Phycisphaerae bacterium]